MIKISVIIPAYNVEEYIEECLISVMNQTLEDIEIICVDDGSTDDTLRILNNLKDEDSRICVISQENKGLSSARNQGILKSKGQYILYLDSDDKLELDAIEKIYSVLAVNDYDILFFSAKCFATEENKLIKDELNRLQTYYFRPRYVLEPIRGTEFFSQSWQEHKFIVSACLQVVKREYLEKNKFKFCEGILHEDNIYTFVTLMNAESVGSLPTILYDRRIRNDSIMTKQKNYKNVYGLFVSYCLLMDELDNYSFRDDNLVRCINEYLYTLISEALRIFYLINEHEKKCFFSLLTMKQEKIFNEFKENRELLDRIGCLEDINQRIRSEKEHILSSVSYRLGMFITCVPRMIRRKIKRIKEKDERKYKSVSYNSSL